MRRSIPKHATLRVNNRSWKENSSSQTKAGQKTKPTRARGPVQRDSKEVMAEVVAKLSGRLGPKPAQENATEAKPKGGPAPNQDRLTVGVDLGDHGATSGPLTQNAGFRIATGALVLVPSWARRHGRSTGGFVASNQIPRKQV